MLWKLTLRDLPGLGKRIDELNSGTYRGIPYKVGTIEDIKPEDIDKLPRESALALRYLDGKPFSRHELEQFKDTYSPLFAPYEKFELVGSYRRGKEVVGDGDALILNPRNRILADSNQVKVINIGQHKARALFRLNHEGTHGSDNPHAIDKYRWVPVDVVFTDTEHYPAAMLHYTGSKKFNIHMTMHCAKYGIKLNEYGLWKNGKRIPASSESQMFDLVGMKHVPPKDREDFNDGMLQDRYRKQLEREKMKREQRKKGNTKAKLVR